MISLRKTGVGVAVLAIVALSGAGVLDCSCRPTAFRCVKGRDVPSTERTSLEHRALQVLASLGSSRPDTAHVTATFSRQFVNGIPTELSSVLAAPGWTLSQVWRAVGTVGTQGVCSLPVDTADHILLRHPDVAILSFEVPAIPLGRRILVELHLTEGVWRLNGMHVGWSTDHGRHAKDFEEAVGGLVESQDALGALLALLGAKKLSAQTPFLSTSEHRRLSNRADELQETQGLREKVSRSSLPREHRFVRFDILLTDEGGMLPALQYVSEAWGDEQAITEEADRLFEAWKVAAPGLPSLYSDVAIFAFPEPPTDPSKKYQRFGSTFSLKTENE